jgi:hypothetical protein
MPIFRWREVVGLPTLSTAEELTDFSRQTIEAFFNSSISDGKQGLGEQWWFDQHFCK